MSPPINAVQILTECGSWHKTGCLSVKSEATAWRIFFRDGEVQYSDCLATDLSQLQYFFLKQGWNDAVKILKKMPQEESSPKLAEANQENEFDQAMAWMWLYKGLDISQLKQLMKDISLDALEKFLWLKNGKTEWHEKEPLPSWIQASVTEKSSLELGQIIKHLNQRLKDWQTTSNNLDSPHQRPYLLDFNDVEKPIPNGTLSPEALSQLAELLRRGLSLRQLSLYLKRDELQVAKLLTPYIDGKVIHLRPPNSPFDQLPNILRDTQSLLEKSKPTSTNSFKIVCIDDSPIMLSEIKRLLNQDKYDITTIDDPIKASAMIFKIKPDLILLDITMPKINGYSLCRLLRHSAVFDATPIIMVSGNTGLIDKARAKLCGATGYLTKPFTQSELVTIIDKHLEPATSMV